jgi:dihydropyrimidinase
VPYTRKQKEAEHWWDVPYGANSLQWSLPVFHHEAVVERDFSYPFLVRVMSTTPARTFGMPQKGTLQPGSDADIVVFDPDESQPVTASTNESGSTFSMYEGREVTGTVKKTFVRGDLVIDDGNLVGEPGSGRFLEREIPDWSAR